MKEDYEATDRESLERWRVRLLEQVSYWRVRLDMWQGELIKQVEASKWTNDWIAPLVEYSITDEQIDPYFVGYWDACELFYRYSFQLFEIETELAMRRVADYTGEGNFKVEVTL